MKEETVKGVNLYEKNNNLFLLLSNTHTICLGPKKKENFRGENLITLLQKLKEEKLSPTERVDWINKTQTLFPEPKKEEPTKKLETEILEGTNWLDFATRFVKEKGVYYNQQKMWWWWSQEESYWLMVDEIDILNQVDSALAYHPKTVQNQTKSQIIEALKRQSRLNAPKTSPKEWIQFKNKVIDLKNENQFTATKDYFITNPIPWKIGESEETPIIDKLFHDWVEKKMVPTLYEIIAYSIIPDYPLHRVFCLNGEGRNGKGTFLQILTKFVGTRNVCSTDFDTLVSRPFEAAKLYKKLVCVMGEINSSMFKKTSLFKKLTGSDMIGFEFKGKDGFDDYNYAKLLIATNKLPESTDKTVGFYSRWTIIDFPNTFEEKIDLLEEIPDYEFNNLARKSIRILKQVLERGKFTNEGNIEERMKMYEDRASPIKEFLKKCCYEDSSVNIPFWELYEQYVAYLEERGFRKASKRELSNLLRLRGYATSRTHYEKRDGSDGTMVIVEGLGLEFKKEEDLEKKEEKEEHGSLRY